ncbi:LacI family DNA-binding transcriptional regulator [Pedobacter sp. AW31-3R]|uniref:LacI family DNA-binding transcriptional regulator n=1 Tax=Pedobacter sp. AW31-3R TaxID=3445781 RepID=UPI003FA07107
MDQVTLKSLAKELNLAVSTVSRALNDSYEISAETKEKVHSLAKKLNYQPNPYASSLRKRSSNTIAVILPEIANNFFSLVINGIEEIAQENGYHVLIYLTHESHQKEADFIRHLTNGRVDGVLMSLSGETDDISHLQELKNSNIPVVFFDRICERLSTVKVTTNDYESGYQATQHLINKGCKQISYLAFSKNLSIDQKRRQGYIDALKDNQLLFREDMVINCGNDQEDNYKKIKTLLSSSQVPDGIFASVELLAILCYEVCRELELNIPGKIKIIGFSNLRTASLLHPSLSTITQPAFEIGKQAASALFQSFRKKQLVLEDKKIELLSELIERDSTK